MKLPFRSKGHLIISLFIHIILFPHLVFLDLDTFFLYSLFIYFPRKEQRPGKQYNIKRKCNTYLNGCYWRYTPYCFSNIGWLWKSIRTQTQKHAVVYFLYSKELGWDVPFPLLKFPSIQLLLAWSFNYFETHKLM